MAFTFYCVLFSAMVGQCESGEIVLHPPAAWLADATIVAAVISNDGTKVAFEYYGQGSCGWNGTGLAYWNLESGDFATIVSPPESAPCTSIKPIRITPDGAAVVGQMIVSGSPASARAFRFTTSTQNLEIVGDDHFVVWSCSDDATEFIGRTISGDVVVLGPGGFTPVLVGTTDARHGTLIGPTILTSTSIWRNGTFTPISVPNTHLGSVSPTRISLDGHVVFGQARSIYDINSQPRGFYWSEADGGVIMPVTYSIQPQPPSSVVPRADGQTAIARGISGAPYFLWSKCHGTQTVYAMNERVFSAMLAESANYCVVDPEICTSAFGFSENGRFVFGTVGPYTDARPFVLRLERWPRPDVLPGDVNGDACVTPDDLLPSWCWFGPSLAITNPNHTCARHDANGDRHVDLRDFVIWQRSVGSVDVFECTGGCVHPCSDP